MLQQVLCLKVIHLWWLYDISHIKTDVLIKTRVKIIRYVQKSLSDFVSVDSQARVARVVVDSHQIKSARPEIQLVADAVERSA